jgi:hypothetical protein
VRDALAEECDDGPGSDDDACNQSCQVTDFWAIPNSDAVLELGRHTVVAGDSGFAVAIVDRAVTPDAPKLVVFDREGKARGSPLDLGVTLEPAEPTSPVVAALPCGAYAAAWTDLGEDGDLLGVALQRIVPGRALQPAPFHANQFTDFNQHTPDILWTGSELVIAWADDADPSGKEDLYFRTFGADLSPTSGETLLAGTTAAEARVALAPFAGSWAAAWRASSAGFEHIVVQAGPALWEIGPLLPGPADDGPALVELDPSHLLVIYTHGGAADPILSGAVLDVAAPGVGSGFPMAPAGTPEGQTHPNAVRAGDRVFVAWRASGPPGDPLAEELFLLELSWDQPTQTLDANSPLPLPRWPVDQSGDQRRPALGATMDALVGVWEDWAPPADAPNVRVELMPLPILRL